AVKGELLWRHPFGNQFHATCASPVYHDGKLFVSSAYGCGSAMLDVTLTDGKWSVKEVWNTKTMQNLMATSVIHQGHVYGWHGDIATMFFRCLDLETGKQKWTERLAGRVCFLAAEGHLICLHEGGTLQLLEMNSTRRIVKGEIKDLLTSTAWAPPA